METKSAIAIQHGKTIRAILCETGDYVDLGPRLQKFWTEEMVQNLIKSGNQLELTETTGVVSDTPYPAVTFFSFEDFMRYFENQFCEDYYIMSEGVWYYAGAGYRSVTPLDMKLQPLYRPRPESDCGCSIHPHAH